ncbi:hypothetical protein Prum_067770 [Phytohabitans rumicis]|uniref:Uncharacterized protein n=1 Tax=Phytohabitans rumicis TaxID=1076125 RepID=A0A6V8LKH5_9ACTN|nr:hypothetical protein Prum_067770 [Phytohabitans rumicis]
MVAFAAVSVPCGISAAKYRPAADEPAAAIHGAYDHIGPMTTFAPPVDVRVVLATRNGGTSVKPPDHPFDPYSAHVQRDPYPHYADLRDTAPSSAAYSTAGRCTCFPATGTSELRSPTGKRSPAVAG